MGFIGSFEHDKIRHLILSEPTDRTLIVDTFCGKQFSRQGDGYCHANLPRRAEACPACVRRVEEIVEMLDA